MDGELLSDDSFGHGRLSFLFIKPIAGVTIKLAYAITAAALIASNASAITYSNDFSNPATASDFVPDRGNPGGFNIAGGTININVLAADAPGFTDSFYNFHGLQTAVGDFNEPASSSLSVDLYVPSSWDGATTKRGGDLWARIDDVTEPNPGNDYYPTIGVYNYADGSGAQVSLFSPNSSFGGSPFLDLPNVPINFDAFNTLTLKLGPTGVDYIFNGVVVASDVTAGYLLPGTQIEQAFLQGWQGDADYVATFDNLNVAVPEPTTLAALFGASSLVLRRRRA